MLIQPYPQPAAQADMDPKVWSERKNPYQHIKIKYKIQKKKH